MADLLGAVSVSVKLGAVPSAMVFALDVPNDSYGGFLVPSGAITGGVWEVTSEGSRSTPIVDFGGLDSTGLDPYWFEKVHSFPQFFELGNILATSLRDLEIYNAYREESRSLTAFVNNADAGVTLIGFPGLPATITQNNGLVFEVQVSTVGPPELDGTLDFTLDVASISVPITGTRVVMFPFEPETPVSETLEFLTDVLTSVDGSEQRVSVRKKPRQIISMQIKTEEGHERRRMQALINSWHPRVFGLPIWFEARPIQAPVVATDVTVQVDTTYADFRVGSLAMVWSDSETFDSLEIASKTDTSITFSTGVVNDHASNALVIPLRVANTDARLTRLKHQVGLTEMRVKFTTLDNDTDIASTAAFSTHNSKAMLDGPNLMTGSTHDDNLIRQADRLDNQTAALIQFSDWSDSLPMTRKGFLGEGAQAIWEARQLVHALRGSQVSFYLPTFWYDLIVVNDLSSGSTLMDIENIGYETYIQAREPNKSVWIELTDGTILTRQVTGYAVVSDTVERLTVDVAWASTTVVADIARVSFLQLVRIANDRVSFEHDYAGDAKITMDILGVKQ